MPVYEVAITIRSIVFGEDEDDAEERAEECKHEIIRDHDTEADLSISPLTMSQLKGSDYLNSLPYGVDRGEPERTCRQILEDEAQAELERKMTEPAPGQGELFPAEAAT